MVMLDNPDGAQQNRQALSEKIINHVSLSSHRGPSFLTFVRNSNL